MATQDVLLHNGNSGEWEMIRQEVFRIGAKLDALPQSYVLKAEYDQWRSGVDKRLDGLETDSKAGREWANNEHSKLQQQVVESERRIIAKLEERGSKQDDELRDVQKESQAFKTLLLVNIIAWIVVPTLFLAINYVLSAHR